MKPAITVTTYHGALSAVLGYKYESKVLQSKQTEAIYLDSSVTIEEIKEKYPNYTATLDQFRCWELIKIS